MPARQAPRQVPKEIVKMLTDVGFSSPPGWIKPYSVHSNGEQFRCDLAKALLGYYSSQEQGRQSTARRLCRQQPTGTTSAEYRTVVGNLLTNDLPTVCFDEYTGSVLNLLVRSQISLKNNAFLIANQQFRNTTRNVAKIASASLAKGIKSGKIPCRFVAVTCHYDILGIAHFVLGFRYFRGEFLRNFPKIIHRYLYQISNAVIFVQKDRAYSELVWNRLTHKNWYC